MATITKNITAAWSGETLTFVATQSGTQIGTGSATVTALASGLYKATATVDLSSASAGVVDLVLIDANADVAWDGELRVDSSGNLVDPLPSVASAANGGLPTVDDNNRVAGVSGDVLGNVGGIAGDTNTLDDLKTAQDAQHAATLAQATTAATQSTAAASSANTAATNSTAIKAVTDQIPDGGALTSIAADAETAATGGGSPVLQHDIADAFTWKLTGRSGANVEAQRPIRMSSQSERPRVAFDTRWVSKEPPLLVTDVTVYDSEDAETAALTLAAEDDTDNCGVRSSLVMSRVTGCTAAGTYTVKITVTFADTSTLVLIGDIITP